MKNIMTWTLLGIAGLTIASIIFDKTILGIGIGFICLIIGMFLDPDLDGCSRSKRKPKPTDYEELHWYNKYIKK